MRGALIAIEGIDGAGNTTQSRLLARWLRRRGFNVVLTKEPTNGPIGRLIRRRLSEGVADAHIDALLFAADRADHVARVIAPSLSLGALVVTDRYVESSIAYQGAQGASEEWIEEVNRFAPKPDLTVVLDVDPEVALSRKRGRRHAFEEEGFLRRVREIMLRRARERGHVVVDASADKMEVHREVRRAVERAVIRSLRPTGR